MARGRRIITKKVPDEASQIAGQLHDKWFDLDAVHFEPNTGEWSVAIGDSPKGHFDSMLVVTEVKGWDCVDTERVGLYDIHHITIDRKNLTLEIIGCIPIRVLLRISPSSAVSVRSRA